MNDVLGTKGGVGGFPDGDPPAQGMACGAAAIQRAGVFLHDDHPVLSCRVPSLRVLVVSPSDFPASTIIFSSFKKNYLTGCFLRNLTSALKRTTGRVLLA
jgi:hypothetical protein